MEIAIAAVLIVAGALSVLASRRDVRAMRTYRERSRRELGTEWSRISVAVRTTTKGQVRRGKAVSDPNAADLLLREYDTMGIPPDFTTRSGLVGLAGATIICVLAAMGGSYFIAIVAGLVLLFFLAMTVWKWRLHRSMATSIAATRRLHQLR